MDMKDFVNKVEEFRNQKGMYEKVLERYYAYQPKLGVEVKVPFKKYKKNN